MRRRRLTFGLGAIGLLAASAAAVMADTPVRRWLVPPPEAATLAALDTVLAEVRIPPVPLPEAAARLGELAGVPVVVDWTRVAAADQLREKPVELDFANVTLGDALQPFVHLLVETDASGRAAAGSVRADRGRLVLGAGSAGPCVRAYDVRPVLPHDAAAATPAGPARDALRSVPDPLAASEADVLKVVEHEAMYGGVWRPAPARATARRFGRYAVVRGARDDHDGVEQLLHGLAKPDRPGRAGRRVHPLTAYRRMTRSTAGIRIDGTPLETVLAEFAAEFGVHLFVDWARLESIGMGKRAQVAMAVQPSDFARDDAIEFAAYYAQDPDVRRGQPARPRLTTAGGVAMLGVAHDLYVRFPRVYDVSDLLGERVLWARAGRADPGGRPTPPADVAGRARQLLTIDLFGTADGKPRSFAHSLNGATLIGGRLVVPSAEQSRHRQVEHALEDLRRATAQAARPAGPESR